MERGREVGNSRYTFIMMIIFCLFIDFYFYFLFYFYFFFSGLF